MVARTIDCAEAIGSRWPRIPQAHRGPSGWTSQCPNFPARPVAPDMMSPSIIRALAIVLPLWRYNTAW